MGRKIRNGSLLEFALFQVSSWMMSLIWAVSSFDVKRKAKVNAFH